MCIAQLFTRLDVRTGEAQSWCPGDRCFCEELIFVPGPRGDVEEDDGVLLGMVFDGESMRTSLAVRTHCCLTYKNGIVIIQHTRRCMATQLVGAACSSSYVVADHPRTPHPHSCQALRAHFPFQLPITNIPLTTRSCQALRASFLCQLPTTHPPLTSPCTNRPDAPRTRIRSCCAECAARSDWTSLWCCRLWMRKTSARGLWRAST